MPGVEWQFGNVVENFYSAPSLQLVSLPNWNPLPQLPSPSSTFINGWVGCVLWWSITAYCTGLLLARRHLKKFQLDEDYPGNEMATGEDFNVEEGEGKRPFRVLLDVGLVRTTTGNRVFGALKGALDGGLDIPHSEKRFAGFSKEDKSLNAETHCKYILGGYIADYMKLLKEEEPEKYQAHFSGLLKAGFKADDLAEMYTSVHVAIRADPTAQLTKKNAPTEKKIWKTKKLSYEERKAALISRLNALNEEGNE